MVKGYTIEKGNIKLEEIPEESDENESDDSGKV